MKQTRQGWYEFIPEGVDLPNKMTLGAWIIVGIILAAILGGFIYIFSRWWSTRIPWKKLPGPAFGAFYYGKDHQPNVALLTVAFLAVYDLLVKYTAWRHADIVAALTGCRIYIMPTKTWTDMTNAGTRQVAGLDPAGVEVIVGSDYAALLHECAHQCEDFIDKHVDYGHEGWGAKGIREAEEEYAKWLSAQRVASGITNMG